ncbi:leucyl aminopeptidase [Brachybacterium muris]|uniref:Probable cytosol aminopeptidase n=1 Tax=Brachybacterium muris UCD-AY4 TaxID=1249481 RepID=A0A022KX20_9MICO|nr:leucyl aminopeptidase [Brachybacterium muris]EYT50421.1 aminopeptidase A [Brachybacterium muris UCD-AY4]MBM7500745.1 leucyl aminopeptidase [Brachybacterium muris]MCT1430255.1 leucyl aminopeptidase [Brachybacterium muris]MCT1654034.1 leucyl aminopeptidase [Brachybacterium muris]MCT1997079.1 leucyl aminopeptidase [Brachybacterium muris]
MPTISISTASVRDVEADVLILPLLAGQDDSPATVPGSSEISEAIASLEPSSARGDVHRIPSFSLAAAGSLLLVGVGASSLDEVEAEDLRLAYGAATRALTGVSTAALALPGGNAEQLAAAVEGAALGAYAFITHKSESSKAKPALESVVVLAEDETGATAAAERAEVLAGSVDIARDLVNTPPNLLYPAEFARRAEEAVADLPITVTVLDEKELAEGGYGGIVGVGQGSSRPPRLVRLEYAPEGAKQSVALVGKGITFDTGGISIKPAAGMDEMTSDMTGAATVLAATVGAARLGLDVRITTFLALAENMPGGGAQRPGDVVTMRNGMTVEVLNTDAEGRMVMADALVDAVATEPDLVMDVATLTGAAMVALGKRTAAVMGTEGGRDTVMAASAQAGEPFWPLPFPAELRADITGRVADLRNIGERWGGALSAGVFLKEFVGETEWAHLDIAGPAFASAPLGYMGKGATGMSVRTVLQVLEDRAR